MIRDTTAVFNLGSSANATRPLTFTTGPSHSESPGIASSTGGNYGSQTTADIVYLQKNGGSVFYRSYNPEKRDFNGSVLVSTVQSGRDIDDNKYLYTADVNADGYDDLVGLSRNLDGNNAQINVYLGGKATSSVDSNGISVSPFAAPLRINILTGNKGLDSFYFPSLDDMAFADMNGDGILDIVVAGLLISTNNTSGGGTGSSATAVYSIGLGDKTGGFAFATMAGTGPGFGNNLPASRVTAGDFNGDGLADLAFGYLKGVAATGDDEAFVWFGTSNDMTTSFRSPIAYSNGWQNAQDLQAVRPSPTSALDQLVVAFNTSTHIASFNRDRSLLHDVKIDGTPRGPLGTEADYNGDGLADIMFANGGSSTIGINYDWTGSSAALTQVKIPMLGDDIQNATGVDFDGDGQLDFFGSKDSTLYTYFNTSGIAMQMTAIRLVENQRVPGGAINGVAQSLLTGDGNSAFAVTLLGSIAGYCNAVGYYEIGQDGTFGPARFLNTNLPDQAAEAIGVLQAGSRLGFFLVVDGERLNPDLLGDFHFTDAEGTAARLSGTPPLLLRTDGGAAVRGTVYHSADANPFDNRNLLNEGGRIQALSRGDADSLTIAFEDTLLADGDADFNDMIMRVTRTDNQDIFGG